MSNLDLTFDDHVHFFQTFYYVQTIVMKSEVASPATIHKGLAILERQGFISMQVDPTDTRRRIVSPTDRAQKLMARLSDRVRQWAGGLPG